MRLVIAMFMAAAVSMVAQAAATEQDSGLRCRFSPGSLMVAGQIECTVVANEIVVHKVSFNRGNCPARFDDARAERAYYEFWGATPENQEWWRRTDYHGRYTFGKVLKAEASGECGNVEILEFEIQTDAGNFTWSVR